MIENKDSKLISVCLINDYTLITDIYIFVYGRAECAFISLECKKVKLPILNNFDISNNSLKHLFVKFKARYQRGDLHHFMTLNDS